MEATTALSDGIASIFSLCGLCTEKQRLQIVVPIVSYILETVDMVTDWMNWNQWRSVGGYNLYHFVFIFQTTFLRAAAMGTLLWTIQVILIIHKCRQFIRTNRNRYRNRFRREEMGNVSHVQESEDSSLSSRFGFTVRVLIGLTEDLPVMILLYYSVAAPFCGVPAKQERYSPITVATIVSSMLNSMWTMFILYWDLFGCNKKTSNAQCCCTVIRSMY